MPEKYGHKKQRISKMIYVTDMNKITQNRFVFWHFNAKSTKSC